MSPLKGSLYLTNWGHLCLLGILTVIKGGIISLTVEKKEFVAETIKAGKSLSGMNSW